MEFTSSQAEEKSKKSPKRGFSLRGEKFRETVTGWLFISPAVLLTTLFGLFPIGFATYMSFHKWRLKKGRFFCMEDDSFNLGSCLENYTEIIGDWYGAFLFVLGILILVGAYWIWSGEKKVFATKLNDLSLGQMFLRLSLPILLLLGAYNYYSIGLESFDAANTRLEEVSLSSRLSENAVSAWDQSNQTQAAFEVSRACDGDEATVDVILSCLNNAESTAQTDGVLQFVTVFIAMAIAAWLILFAHTTGFYKTGRYQETRDVILRFFVGLFVMAIGAYLLASGYGRMLIEGQEEFIRGLSITFYYAVASVPIQLSLGLILAYVLYQKLKLREVFRMLFFLPYVTPAVAAAVVFRIVFSPREGLVNNLLESFGFQGQPWINGSHPFLNEFFGLNLEGFFAGPSMALVSIIILGIWTYTGYNAIIFLAGLGQIPEDLYEAAEVDGANNWHLFRHITVPLLSPITFYLSVLAFIGTFKAFNHIFVMRTPFAQGSVDTASLIIYDTFKSDFQYGLATAQAILLFLVILGLTQIQRTFFEKNVFYG